MATPLMTITTISIVMMITFITVINVMLLIVFMTIIMVLTIIIMITFNKNVALTFRLNIESA